MDKWKLICSISMIMGILIGILFIWIGWNNVSMTADKAVMGQNVVVMVAGMFLSCFFLLILIHGLSNDKTDQKEP